jgi:peptidoglycan/LPS O-acetylase OafA/YrhL
VFGLGLLTVNSQCFKGLACASLLAWLASGGHFPNVLPVRALTYVGRRSYSIYLIHGWVAFRLLNLSNHLRGTPYFSDLLCVVLTALAAGSGVLAGLVYFRLVEWPVHTFARRLTYRR